MSDHPKSEWEFPKDGIVWRKWGEETAKEILAKDRPVLLFVADPDPTVFPFLREFFRAAPKNARLRALLHDQIVGLFMEAGRIPEEEIGLYDAGNRYHLAILSPSGLTPMVTFNMQTGDADKLTAEVVEVIERLLSTWI